MKTYFKYLVSSDYTLLPVFGILDLHGSGINAFLLTHTWHPNYEATENLNQREHLVGGSTLIIIGVTKYAPLDSTSFF